MITSIAGACVAALVIMGFVEVGLRIWLSDQLETLGTLAHCNHDPEVLVSVAGSADAVRWFWFASDAQKIEARRIADRARRRARLLL